MTLTNYKRILRHRMDRWKQFHASNAPGDLMVYVQTWQHPYPSLGFYLGREFGSRPAGEVMDPRQIPAMIEGYIDLFHASLPDGLRHDDDMVPDVIPDWGVGGTNAAMTWGEPAYDGLTSWFEPELAWEQIEQLAFNPDNPHVQFALNLNKALWHYWQEDFHVLPHAYRSPLDGANGVRGNALFEELYTAPEKVHRLIDWCADWILSMEAHLAANDGRPDLSAWGTSIWGTWMPDRSIFVNGDPIGLISREMAIEFEQPYTAKVFQASGGGFFHNHTLGLRQADLAGRTPGTRVQFIVDDPKQPTMAEALLDHPDWREMLLEASLITPIGMLVAPDRIEELLDVVRHGRFIIAIDTPASFRRNCNDLIAHVRDASNLD